MVMSHDTPGEPPADRLATGDRPDGMDRRGGSRPAQSAGDPLAAVLHALGPVHRTGASWMARCPAHDDRDPSLSVSVGDTQPVVLHCHAGCSTEAVLSALGLDVAAISTERDPPVAYGEVGWELRGVGTLTTVYPYRDAAGAEVMQVCRFRGPTGKTFRQRRRDGDRWAWTAPPEPPIYRLPEVLAAIEAGEVVYVAEGEKDADALARLGFAATCNPMGAGKWRPWHTTALAGAARVVVVADRDEPGRRHAREVVRSLAEHVPEVLMVEPLAGKDAFDHLAAGLTVEHFVITYDSTAPARPHGAWGIVDYLDQPDPEHHWVIPGLIARGERFGLTGFEGRGKTTLLRQLAVTTSLGRPPFAPITTAWTPHPATVLFIDLENGEAINRAEFRDVTDRIATPPNDRLVIIDRPQGLDVLDDEDRLWLQERVTAFRPDLLIVTPWYKLSPELEQHSEAVYTRRVQNVLDEVRVAGDCALAMELHCPVGDNEERRSLRPTGPGVILRWFEFGFGMRPDGEREATWDTWRGSRAHRSWPARTTMDGPLPWTAVTWRGQR
jgi:hypothetical protein